MRQNENNIIKINFQNFLKVIWKEKFLFVAITLVFIILGLIYAFTAKEEFISEGRIMPEIQSKDGKLGGLAGLASLAGVDLANLEGTEAIRPDLYPDILTSTPFFLELFKQKIVDRNNRVLIFEEFYHNEVEENEEIKEKDKKKYPVKENGFLIINHLNEKRIDDLKKRIEVNIDKKSGVISISVKMPDPITAAKVALFSMTYLTEYVTRYRIEKLKKDLDFLGERVEVARGKFYNTQTKKAQYSDQFQLSTIRLQSADTQRERIESDYKISSTFYNELLKKYEEAKIKLQQETPVFQVLEPPVAPTEKSQPKRAIILLLITVFGGLVASIIILIKKKNYKEVIAE